MSGHTTFQRSLYGQMIVQGWIGEHPGDGGDFSMLMAYSPGDGELGSEATQLALRELVAAWGMREGTMLENPSIKALP